MSFFQCLLPFIPVKIGNHDKNTADTGYDQERRVLLITGITAAYGEQNSSEYTAGCRNNQEVPCYYVAQAHNVAEVVFGKSGNEEKEKGDKCPPVFQKVVVFLNDLRLDSLLDKGKTEKSGKREGYPGSYRETDGREYRPHHRAVKIPADEAGNFSGYRGSHYLQNLDSDEGKFIIGMKGKNECDDFLLACEEIIDIILNGKVGCQSDKKEQNENSENKTSIHRGDPERGFIFFFCSIFFVSGIFPDFSSDSILGF
jgi:hypothetical protein